MLALAAVREDRASSYSGVPTGGMAGSSASPAKRGEERRERGRPAPPTPSSSPSHTLVVNSLVHSARTSADHRVAPSATGAPGAGSGELLLAGGELEVDLLEAAGVRPQLVQLDPGGEGAGADLGGRAAGDGAARRPPSGATWAPAPRSTLGQPAARRGCGRAPCRRRRRRRAARPIEPSRTSRPAPTMTTRSTVCSTSDSRWLETSTVRPGRGPGAAGSRAATGCPRGPGRWPARRAPGRRGRPAGRWPGPAAAACPASSCPPCGRRRRPGPPGASTSSARASGRPAAAAVHPQVVAPGARRVERGLQHRADGAGGVGQVGVGHAVDGRRRRRRGGSGRAPSAGSWSCRRRSGPGSR